MFFKKRHLPYQFLKSRQHVAFLWVRIFKKAFNLQSSFADVAKKGQAKLFDNPAASAVVIKCCESLKSHLFPQITIGNFVVSCNLRSCSLFAVMHFQIVIKHLSGLICSNPSLDAIEKQKTAPLQRLIASSESRGSLCL